MSPSGEITALLQRAREGDEKCQEQLITIVYGELRRLAAARLASERREHTLQPSALVNEAYLRMVQPGEGWQNRAHFFSMAARTMRNVLVDHARARNARRRTGGRRVDLAEADQAIPVDRDAVILLDTALNQLAALNPVYARVVEMHFFAGMTFEEIASQIDVSSRTVKRYWDFARTWLQKYMREGESDAR